MHKPDRDPAISAMPSGIVAGLYVPFYACPECQLDDRQEDEVDFATGKECEGHEDDQQEGKYSINNE